MEIHFQVFNCKPSKKSNILSRKQQSFLSKLIYDNNGYLFYHVKKD